MCSWKRYWITITEILLIQSMAKYFVACGHHWVTMWPDHVTKVTMAKWFIFHRISYHHMYRWSKLNHADYCLPWLTYDGSKSYPQWGSTLLKTTIIYACLFMNENFTAVGKELVLYFFPGSQWSTAVAAPTSHHDDGLIINQFNYVVSISATITR